MWLFLKFLVFCTINKKMIIPVVFIATSFILFANAELHQCGEPFHSVDVSKVEVVNCARENERCNVSYIYPHVTLYYNYTAPKDFSPIGYHPRCKVSPVCRIKLTVGSKSTGDVVCGSQVIIERGKSYINNPQFDSVKKGDQFYLTCVCGINIKLEKGEIGTFNTTLWLTEHCPPFDEKENMVSYGDCVKGDVRFVDLNEQELDEEEDEEEE